MLALRGLARSRLTDSVGRSSSWTSCNECWMRRRASSVARGARPRFDSIAPSWRSTLARHSRPNHKFGVLMYQCLNSQAPQYLVAAARCLQCRWSTSARSPLCQMNDIWHSLQWTCCFTARHLTSQRYERMYCTESIAGTGSKNRPQPQINDLRGRDHNLPNHFQSLNYF